MIDQVPPTTTIDEIIVTAARLPPAASEAAFAVVRLDDVALNQSRRLDDALSQVPAVSLFRRTSSLSSNPTTQGISLRAIGPSGAGRALVTLDGVPLNDPFGGWVLWSQLPIAALSGADIIRGAGAGPYGAGALTGVIQLREREQGASFEAVTAERGGSQLQGAMSSTVGSVRITGAAQHELSDGYISVRGPDRGLADEPLSLETRSLSLRLDAPVGAAALSIRASAYDEERDSGLAGTASKSSGQLYSATLARPAVAGNYGWRLQAWHRQSDFANSSASVSADRNVTTPASEQYATPASGSGVNVALRRQVSNLAGGSLEWEVGADARFSEGETQERFRYMAGEFTRDRKAGGETSIAGLYTDVSWSNRLWLVTGGLRLDGWKNQAGHRREWDSSTGSPTLDETDPDRSGEVISGRIGARRFLAHDWSLRGAAYTGFRPATLNELHRPFRVGNDLTEANAALSPETLKGVEVGLAYEGQKTQMAATLFWNEIEDAIVNVTLAEGPGTFPRAGFVPAGGVLRQRQNAGAIEALGIEVMVSQQVNAQLKLQAAVSFTDAAMDGGVAAPQLTDLRPAQAPQWSATASADWQVTQAITLAMQARYEGQRFDDDLNSRSLGSALTLDGRAIWQATPMVEVWLGADNLLDEEVAVSMTGSGTVGYGPPQTFRLGIRYTY